MPTIKKWIKITPQEILRDGTPILMDKKQDDDMLVYAYRQLVRSYPKFFKMDGLSRLGFIATELLLMDDLNCIDPSDNTAVIFFNRGGSIDNDRDYQKTISDKENFYPSPAIFVYTLPNIVTGEIAIRNHFHGETSFYVLDEWSAQSIVATVEDSMLSDGMIKRCICGWVEYDGKTSFEAEVLLIERNGEGRQLDETVLNTIRQEINN